MQEWEWEEEQRRREAETFRRFHRLRKAGWVVAWARDVEDAFFLDHLGSGPDLILYPSGVIVSLDKNSPLCSKKGGDSDRILNCSVDDVADFDRWIISVTKPTWWQRGAPDREKYVYQPGCLVGLVAVSIGVWKVLEALWNALTS